MKIQKITFPGSQWCSLSKSNNPVYLCPSNHFCSLFRFPTIFMSSSINNFNAFIRPVLSIYTNALPIFCSFHLFIAYLSHCNISLTSPDVLTRILSITVIQSIALWCSIFDRDESDGSNLLFLQNAWQMWWIGIDYGYLKNTVYHKSSASLRLS